MLFNKRLTLCAPWTFALIRWLLMIWILLYTFNGWWITRAIKHTLLTVWATQGLEIQQLYNEGEQKICRCFGNIRPIFFFFFFYYLFNMCFIFFVFLIFFLIYLFLIFLFVFFMFRWFFILLFLLICFVCLYVCF